MKELFASAAADTAELESHKTYKPQKFMNMSPDYYGDADETDEKFLELEREAEADGSLVPFRQRGCSLFAHLLSLLAWEGALDKLREEHSLSLETPPPLPQAHFISLDEPSTSDSTPDASSAPGSKRKAGDSNATAKKSKVEGQTTSKNGFMSVLREADLRPPQLLTMAQTEAYIIAQQKKALLEEYGA